MAEDTTTDTNAGAARQQVLLDVLERGLDQLSSCTGLDPSLIARHRPHIRELLKAAIESLAGRDRSTVPDNGRAWSRQPLLENDELRVGLVTVIPDTPVPLHDHPGSTGLLVVLEESLYVRHYAVSDTAKTEVLPNVVELVLTGHQEFSANDFLFFGPDRGNIHTVSANKGPCVLFQVLFNPFRTEDRSWFMPLDGHDNDADYLTVRRMPEGSI